MAEKLVIFGKNSFLGRFLSITFFNIYQNFYFQIHFIENFMLYPLVQRPSKSDYSSKSYSIRNSVGSSTQLLLSLIDVCARTLDKTVLTTNWYMAKTVFDQILFDAVFFCFCSFLPIPSFKFYFPAKLHVMPTLSNVLFLFCTILSNTILIFLFLFL